MSVVVSLEKPAALADRPDEQDAWRPCEFCGVTATAACPACDEQHDHIWRQHAALPEPREEDWA